MKKITNLFDLTSSLLDDISYLNFGENYNVGYNFKEDKEKFLVEIDLPGIKKENVKINSEDNYLLVEWKTRKDKDKKIKFDIIGGNPEKIEAKMEDGVLYITIPKLESLKTKLIEIK